MSDSDYFNFGSDLESDSFSSHLGASDEEVDDECNVNAVRMQPTLDVGKIASEQKDWGRPKTLEDECVLQVPDDEDLYDDEALARSALAKRVRREYGEKTAKMAENGHNSEVHATIGIVNCRPTHVASSTAVVYLVSPTNFPVHSATVRLVLEAFSRVMFDVTRAK